MTIHDGYILTELSGQTYLLPYGQNIASFKRGVKLNESGRLIWDALCAGKTEDELLPLLAAHFQMAAKDASVLRADIAQFLEQLRAQGIIDRPAPRFCFPSDSPKKFRIGTVLLQLNFPEHLIAEEFFPFAANEADTAALPSTDDTPDAAAFPFAAGAPEANAFLFAAGTPDAAADLTVSVRFCQPPTRPVGKVLVRSSDLVIMEAADCYSLLFPASPDIIECQIDKAAHFACFYCKDLSSETCREELFHGIRFIYLLQAQAHGLFAIHSASFLYRDRAWLFSAASGTGKSTHTNLWKSIYDVKLLNGDLNLLGIKNGKPVVYGLPWCGTSGISTPDTVPLGGIIFLRQAQADTTEALSADTIQLMLSQRLISPAWTADMLLSCLSFSGQVAPHIVSFLLRCTKNPNAAHVCKAAIDEALQRSNFLL